MVQRTCNLIMCCKGHLKRGGRTLNPISAIAEYMSDECECPLDAYTPSVIEDILREALFDFFDGVDEPSVELRRLLERYNSRTPYLFERIASYFSVVRIKNVNDSFVNGFTQELLDQSRIDLAERK